MTFKFASGRTIQILFLIVLLSPGTVFAASEIYTRFFSNDALSGYDPVAYFNENKPVKGFASYTMSYKGAKWSFSSQQNLDRFKADPIKYAPQYGGYCAWAIAQNDTQKGDPDYWTIHDGKLYLNYDADVKNKWLANKDTLIRKADRYWPEVLN